MMWMFKLNVLVFLLLFVGKYNILALQDVTVDLFGTKNYGTVAAFGDFNSDKQTDIFIIREQSELVIFLADSKIPYFKPKVHITSDILPSFNGDMVPDIFGVTHQLTTEFCYFTNRSPVWQNALTSPVNMRIPHSNAFIDLNKDFTADLFLTTEGPKFETWISKPIYSTFLLALLLQYHILHHFLSHSLTPAEMAVFVLVKNKTNNNDGDGYQDHLLPVCLDEACQHSAIYLAKPGATEWVPVLLDFKHKETVWSFVPGKPTQPLALHLGDYNLDGFPDALVVLCNTSGRGQQAFLLENVPCNNPKCQSVGRMFRIHWDQSDLGAIPNAIMATFFDIYEDGILDMLVLSQAEGKKDLIIHALKNNFEADAYFVKVMVLSGLCSNDCPDGVKPFGVNQPGPYVMYTTVDSNGYQKNASAGQLSQSAHFSLQLPYTVLGLGRSANFLDHLFVGIPRHPGETEIKKQEWTAIIPNSQLIVIPYPHNKPRSWSAKLYLTPSNSVLLTAIALIGVCIFILVIIGILHWQEKKADDREKRQEAHRFHFDAM
ncbi:hypothetical protein PAMP_000910 [Pampus punctatissimus]